MNGNRARFVRIVTVPPRSAAGSRKVGIRQLFGRRFLEQSFEPLRHSVQAQPLQVLVEPDQLRRSPFGLAAGPECKVVHVAAGQQLTKRSPDRELSPRAVPRVAFGKISRLWA